MQQSLQEHNGRLLEELVSKTASAERDATHFKKRNDELVELCEWLAERVEEGTELKSQVSEQRKTINGYIKDTLLLECEKNKLVAQMDDSSLRRRVSCLATMRRAHIPGIVSIKLTR
mmetsp:Transcript_19436/g.29512  ORF Transcript_19436/g.29512 Transcript_19436/m.29512 type:complete len:117 (-) Transcript_19436:21-371(-)